MPSFKLRMLTVVILAVTVLAGAVVGQQTCVRGKAISLSLNHHTNNSGHTMLNGHLEQPAEAAWHLDVDLRTSTCGPARSNTKVLTFALTDPQFVRPGLAMKKRVPPGYGLREGFGYFRAGTHALNWMAARDACAREGAHLAFAQSQEEALMLTRHFNFDVPGSRFKSYAWYGASDIAEEGKFVTVTGEELQETGYASFHQGRPDGKTGENCLCINKESPLLEDGTCQTPKAYVCKVPL